MLHSQHCHNDSYNMHLHNYLLLWSVFSEASIKYLGWLAWLCYALGVGVIITPTEQQNFLLLEIFPNILFCVPQNKESHARVMQQHKGSKMMNVPLKT